VYTILAASALAVAGALAAGVPLGAQLRQARRALYEDDLTGLPNRRAWRAELARMHRRGAQAAVVLLDVDRFKDINDTYGHDVGDQVLTEIADRLRTVPARLCARLAGDEFVLLIDGDTAAAQVVAAGAAHVVAATPVEVCARRLSVTVSAGVAAANGVGYEHLLSRADRAMYGAKRAGRDMSASVFRVAARGAA